jgi:cytochrome c553
MNNCFIDQFRKQILLTILFLTFLMCIPVIVFGSVSNTKEEKNTETKKELPGDVKRGQKIFFGLAGIGEDAPVCANCHNTTEIDSLNWYPSSFEIGSKFKKKGLMAFKKAVLSPSTPTMKKVHAKLILTDQDVTDVKSYLDQVAVDGLTPKKPVIKNALLMILLTIIIIIALVDAFFTWKVKFKIIHLVVILLAVAGQVKLVSHAAIALGRSKDYSPDQPIKFSHKVHANQNQIDCLYCHPSAEYGKNAGIPSVNVCMNCHILVAEGKISGKYEIDKVKAAYASKKPIEWIRVHNLPDHVYFNHSQHIGAGKLDCTECHGDVKEMHLIKQVEDLSMGWCIDCHRSKEVHFTDNKYYGDYKQLHEDLKSGKIEKVTVEDIGGTDCMKCHY